MNSYVKKWFVLRMHDLSCACARCIFYSAFVFSTSGFFFSLPASKACMLVQFFRKSNSKQTGEKWLNIFCIPFRKRTIFILVYWKNKVIKCRGFLILFSIIVLKTSFYTLKKSLSIVKLRSFQNASIEIKHFLFVYQQNLFPVTKLICEMQKENIFSNERFFFTLKRNPLIM